MDARFVVLGFIALFLTGCAGISGKGGFDPKGDAVIAQAKMSSPRDFDPEGLAKQDPVESITLHSDPSQVDGYAVLSIQLVSLPEIFRREIRDDRRPYQRYVGTVSGKEIVFRCKARKVNCTELTDVETKPSVLERHVWRAAVLDEAGKPVQIYEAVYRGQGRLLVLFPLDAAIPVGKTLHVWSAYGDFVILVNGALISRENRDIANLPAEFLTEHPSVVRFDQVVVMDRSRPAGKFLLDSLAQEFPLPAPFHNGAVRADYFFGVAKLTREDNGLDCWIGNGYGDIVLTPQPLTLALSVVVSAVRSIPVVTQRDCGKS